MVIYAEYLFAENFITGILILVITGRTCNVEIRKRFLILGGVLCGLFSFIIGIENVPIYLSLLIKLTFSAIVILVVYLPRSRKSFGKLILFFYMTSFALGGITIGCVYLLGAPGMTNNSFIYLEGITYANITVGCALAYWMLDMIIKNIKERMIGATHTYSVEIYINDKSVIVNGVVDSGNYLTEPISGYPVFIMSKNLSMQFFDKGINVNDEMGARVRMIPFQGIGGKRGMLTGVRPDMVILRDGTIKWEIQNLYLAINDCGFFRETHGNEYSILLHRNVLDRGIN